MTRYRSNILLAAVLLAALVAANALLFQGALGHWIAGPASRAIAPVTARLAWAARSLDALTERFDAAAERARLQERETALAAREAEDEQLRRELAFAQAAAGIRERIGREPLAAGAFSWPRQGGVRELTVNRGTRDWVAPGDAVITASGALVGVVRESFADHATVRALDDPAFEVTARIAGTDISGLVRRDARTGLVLDLIAKDEPVTEGQSVVTSGNDRFPAALVIGTIRAVDASATTLFTNVHVEPAVPPAYAGPVLIIRQQ